MAKENSIYISIDPKRGVEGSLKKFKRMCESFGVLKEYKKRQDYKKPSIVLKEKAEASLKRRKKAEFKGRRSSKI